MRGRWPWRSSAVSSALPAGSRTTPACIHAFGQTQTQVMVRRAWRSRAKIMVPNQRFKKYVDPLMFKRNQHTPLCKSED